MKNARWGHASRWLGWLGRGGALAILGATALGCGGDDEPSLTDYLPDIPAATGEAQSVYAGAITAANADELIAGPASSGLAGDFFLRNERARFVIQSAVRVIGVVPQGGNLVDAVARDENGADRSEDHFGELSAIYLVGRTCEHDTMEVVRDGSGGGVAVVRALGRGAVNDFINLKGIGLIGVPPEIDPDTDDEVECATTYILHPDSPTLEVYWTFFNAGEFDVRGPFGGLSDTGGETEGFAPTRGFERAGIDALTTLTEPQPIDYVVYQGPEVAYGVVPRHADQATANAAFVIAGVSVVLYGADALLDILQEEHWYFQLPVRTGVTHRVDVVLGDDAADVEAAYRRGLGEEVVEVAGQVAYASGDVPAGARVGLYQDSDGDGQLGAEDLILSYFDPDAAGAFAGEVPPGNYLVRAEVKDTARSDAVAIQVPAAGLAGVDLELPDPVRIHYTIVDDATGNASPGKITVFGHHSAAPDLRVFETHDRVTGVVRMIPAPHGTSVDVGDGADPPIVVPAGGPYKVVASHGTEWSVAQVTLTAPAGTTIDDLELRLRHVVPTPGYLASEFHQHSVGSPDSPVSRPLRIATFLAEGVEFFASTDHDYVTDFQPLIEALGFDRLVRAVPGIEITPFVYGHFQAYPLIPRDDDASNGAIDWARGTEGFAMIPGEIFDAARDRGAQVIQVNHPRADAAAFSDMAQYFDRCGLVFDYDARVIEGDPLRAPVPLEWLRLPETSLWDDSFNGLEVWNGFGMKDSNDDGVREIGKLDIVMRDWFNFLSFGLAIAPLGNSDSHKVVSDAIGMPRTYVRVVDDSPTAIADGSVSDDVMDTLAGRLDTPMDVVVTNGPHINITVPGVAGSPLGSVVDAAGVSATFTVEVLAPDWAAIDTLEVFVNATPDSKKKEETWLQPWVCYTSRAVASLAATDPCLLAARPAQPFSVELVEVAPGFFRYEAKVDVTIDASDVALVNREGAAGEDAWLVVRVRGNRAIFPLHLDGVTSDNLDVLVGEDGAAIDAALTGVGVPATAFTSPVYIDFDGGGYQAPFAP
jgi:hypothetical protein